MNTGNGPCEKKESWNIFVIYICRSRPTPSWPHRLTHATWVGVLKSAAYCSLRLCVFYRSIILIYLKGSKSGRDKGARAAQTHQVQINKGGVNPASRTSHNATALDCSWAFSTSSNSAVLIVILSANRASAWAATLSSEFGFFVDVGRRRFVVVFAARSGLERRSNCLFQSKACGRAEFVVAVAGARAVAGEVAAWAAILVGRSSPRAVFGVGQAQVFLGVT